MRTWTLKNISDEPQQLMDGRTVLPGKTAEVKPHDVKVLVKADPEVWERA